MALINGTRMLSFQCFRTSIDLFAVAFWQSFFASTLQQSIYQFLSAGDCKEDLVRGWAIFIFIFEGHFYYSEEFFFLIMSLSPY